MLGRDEVEAIRACALDGGLSVAVLFGSTAAGRARADSDVDAAVLSRDGAPLSLRRRRELALDLQRIVGREVDVVDLRTADPLLRFEVVSHGRVLLSDPPDAWTAQVARTLIDHDDIAWILPELVAGVGKAARGAR